MIIITITASILVACDSIKDYIEETSTGGGSDDNSQAQASVPYSAFTLDAFQDFQCTSNWTNRDGGLGLKVGTANGTCQVVFPAESGKYRITLLAQTEREGRSPYRITINGNLVGVGRFPFAQGRVICECHAQPWTRYCPDVVVRLDSGVHYISTGDIIEFYGEEEYLCGKHGAYSKWRGMTFTPAQ